MLQVIKDNLPQGQIKKSVINLSKRLNAREKKLAMDSYASSFCKHSVNIRKDALVTQKFNNFAIVNFVCDFSA